MIERGGDAGYWDNGIHDTNGRPAENPGGAIISLFNEGTNMPVGANSSDTKNITPTLRQGIYLSICRI